MTNPELWKLVSVKPGVCQNIVLNASHTRNSSFVVSAFHQILLKYKITCVTTVNQTCACSMTNRELWKVLSLKPGVYQSIASHASSTARNSAYVTSAFPVHPTEIFFLSKSPSNIKWRASYQWIRLALLVWRTQTSERFFTLKSRVCPNIASHASPIAGTLPSNIDLPGSINFIFISKSSSHRKRRAS